MGTEAEGARLAAAVADQLNKVRRVRGLTFEELGVRAGMAKNSVHRYLNGERVINMDHLARLSAALDVSPSSVVAAATRDVEELARLRSYLSDADLAGIDLDVAAGDFGHRKDRRSG